MKSVPSITGRKVAWQRLLSSMLPRCQSLHQLKYWSIWGYASLHPVILDRVYQERVRL